MVPFMKKVPFYAITITAALLCLASTLVLVLTGNIKSAGPLFILFFAALAGWVL